MFSEAFIDVAGWLQSEVVFSVTKTGAPYCKFMVQTTNNTAKDKSLLTFSCFCWQGDQTYNLLKQLQLVPRDEVFVRGIFSMNITEAIPKPFVNLQIYVKYIKIIRSAAAEKARDEMNITRTIEEIPVKKQLGKVNNVEVQIDKKDNPWG